jgi:hypothetical protein
MQGLALLGEASPTAKDVTEHFSDLRSQLKVDLGVYTKDEAKKSFRKERTATDSAVRVSDNAR